MAQNHAWAANAAAGVAAGVAATAAMDGYWALMARFRPEKSRGEPATSRIAGDLLRRAGLRPSSVARQAAGNVLHWTYGIAWGAVAGVARRGGLRLDAGFGQPLGAALELGGDQYGLYALGYARHPREYPASTLAKSYAAHAVYGLVLWAGLESVHRLRRRKERRAGKLPWAA